MLNFHFSQNLNLGPEESHSVHKIRTTKIVVEEAPASNESCGTFTFSKSSRKAEVSVEEVGSFSLSTPPMEKVVCESNEKTISAVVEESETENLLDKGDISQEPLLVSLSEDKNDDDMDKLMERIMKQRSVLGEILGREETAENEEKNIEQIIPTEQIEKPVIEESSANKKLDKKKTEKKLEDEISKDLEASKISSEPVQEKESSPIIEKIEDEKAKPIALQNIQKANQATKSQPEGSLTNSSLPNS